jgi:hypothetical protein
MKNTAQTKLMEGLRAVWNRENLPEGVEIVETPGGVRIHFLYNLDIPRSRHQANLEKLRNLPKGVTRIQKGGQPS